MEPNNPNVYLVTAWAQIAERIWLNEVVFFNEKTTKFIMEVFNESDSKATMHMQKIFCVYE